MLNIFPISALKDNYIWCLHKQKDCLIVDPGEAQPVIEVLTEKQLNLCGILLTHHHYDHTNGVLDLRHYKNVNIYGPKEIPQVTHPINGGRLKLLDLTFTIYKIPGHTLEHVAYYTPGMVFTGDTLFTGGCGKIFEGTVQQMYDSLSLLKHLPGETAVYCGHEYTVDNLKFAQIVEPHNAEIQARYQVAKERRRAHLPTVPSLLSCEKATNPFLRSDHPQVVKAANQYAGLSLNDPVQVLKILREWKNSL